MKISWRVWLLIICIGLSILAIKPSFESGVTIKSVAPNTTIYDSGIRAGEIIKSINGAVIEDKAQYNNAMGALFTDNESIRVDIKTGKGEYTFLANGLNLTVEDVPRTRIQTGLDLRGGARALVQPEERLTDQQMDELLAISRNRFNVYGLADVNIKSVSDLTGNKYMLVEVAGATPGDLEQLIAQQGKFEARIANQTVFEGGKQDIADVCRNDAKCSGVQSCSPTQEGYACSFMFSVYLTQDAAEKHASITEDLSLDETGKYLKDKLYLFVDDKEVDSLNVGAELKGKVTTQISIQGPGVGKTQEEAYNNAKANMNKLQTILITGSLPYKLDIVKLDTISPVLGSRFNQLILVAGAASILAVALIILIRYRKLKASLALLFTSFSEILIILGVAALIKWNLDLPSIAGILATIGTGVDQQIVILDEARKNKQLSIGERMGRALFIVISAYLVSLVSLLPLYWAGAGLFKGFAITTIIGITAGVLITRPAFSDMIKDIIE